MHPIAALVPILVLCGGRKRRQRCKGRIITGKGPANACRPATIFPWIPHRVNEVLQSLIAKGERDVEILSRSAAKIVYPLDPVTSGRFDWDSAESDAGARMTLSRIALRAKTLLSEAEEKEADVAIRDVSAVIGFAPPEADSPGVLEPAPADPVPPVTDRPTVGAIVRIDDGDRIRDKAREALEAAIGRRPSSDMVAEYTALIVSSPYNSAIEMSWDRARKMPTARGRYRGDSAHVWFPELNRDLLASGIVTTLGVEWSDGATGLVPPPGVDDV